MARWASVVCGLAVVGIVAGAAGVSLGRQEKEAAQAKHPEGAFVATAWLRLQGRPDQPAGDRGDFEAFRTTQIRLLRSPLVINAVLRRPGIGDLPTLREPRDPVDWITDRLEIGSDDTSEVIFVRLRGDRPEDLRRIVAAVTEVYLEDIVNMERQDRLARRDALERKSKELSSTVREMKAEQGRLAEAIATDVGAPLDHVPELVMQEVAGLRAERAAVRTEARSIGADLAVAEAIGDGQDPRRTARLQVLERQAAELATEIEQAVARLARLTTGRTDLDRARAEIEKYQRLVDQIGLQLESSTVDLTAPPRVTLLEKASVDPVE